MGENKVEQASGFFAMREASLKSSEPEGKTKSPDTTAIKSDTQIKAGVGPNSLMPSAQMTYAQKSLNTDTNIQTETTAYANATAGKGVSAGASLVQRENIMLGDTPLRASYGVGINVSNLGVSKKDTGDVVIGGRLDMSCKSNEWCPHFNAAASLKDPSNPSFAVGVNRQYQMGEGDPVTVSGQIKHTGGSTTVGVSFNKSF